MLEKVSLELLDKGWKPEPGATAIPINMGVAASALGSVLLQMPQLDARSVANEAALLQLSITICWQC
jgi:hypothetical protein